jgi:hypothetical protein
MKRLFLYLHTHWDREWYRPFEAFRSDLVEVVRRVLDGLEAGTLPSIYLDGQACVLEDAVWVAPELTPRIVALMEVGRLTAGPWYVLADQMLVSGESLIRNLKLGMSLTGRFGRPAPVGYCPDTFGHSQDLPRILAGFGLKSAVVWRGVPPQVGQPAFRWQSPDGSSILAYHLGRGYYQTAFHEPRPVEELEWFLLSWLQPEQAEGVGSTVLDRAINGALVPIGADHAAPPHEFSARLSAIRELLATEGDTAPMVGEEDVRVQVVTLPEFFQERERLARGQDSEATVAGELRDNSTCGRHGRAYLLPGVLSARLYVKQDNRRSEHRLARISEPLHALLSAGGVIAYPADELRHAWRLLLQNQPHDSICGCSVDAVAAEMRGRTAGLHQVLDALDRRARHAVARAGYEQVSAGRAGVSADDPDFAPNRLMVYNLSASRRSRPVPLSYYCDVSRKLPRGDWFQLIARRTANELFTETGIVPYYKSVDAIDALVWAESVPALGVKELRWPFESGRQSEFEPVVVKGNSVSNGLVTVTVTEDGVLAVTQKFADGSTATFRLGHTFRDVGDGGDSYNFDPLAGDVAVEATFGSLAGGQKGPLVGSLVLTYQMDIPEEHVEVAPGSDEAVPVFARSRRRIAHKIKTELSLMRGVPVVFFDTEWNNRASDHRLEVVFDTGALVARTFSENHFSLVARAAPGPPPPLPVEPGCEAPPDRFPCQRFFIANGQVFLNAGLPEYGVDGRCVGITILRSVSRLSRGRLRTRGGGAGPHIDTPGAACLGLNRVRYGWTALPGTPDTDGAPSGRQLAAAYDAAAEFEGTLWACLGDRAVPPSSRSFFHVDNPLVNVTALFCEGSGTFFLRLLNISSEAQSATVETSLAVEQAHMCSLDGVPGRMLVSRAAGSPEAQPGPGHSTGAMLHAFALVLGAHELATVRLVARQPG